MTDPTPSAEQMAELRAKATPGDWAKVASKDVLSAVIAPGVATIACDFERDEDAAFIAAASRYDFTAQAEAAKRKDERIAELEGILEHAHYWYATRFQRLRDFADKLTEDQKHEYYSIVANGTGGVHEPPTYAQMYNTLKWRAEEAEKAVVAKEAEIEGLVQRCADLCESGGEDRRQVSRLEERAQYTQSTLTAQADEIRRPPCLPRWRGW